MRTLTLRLRAIAERVGGQDRGAVLAITATSVMVVVFVAAITVDIGRGLAERRYLDSAVDAAALAAAQAYSDGEPGCDDVAKDFLDRNAADSIFRDCQVFGDTTDGTYGWVIVDADLDVDHILADVMGISETTLNGRSVAAFGAAGQRIGSGTRPFGLCLESLEQYPEFIAWQAGDPTEPSAVMRLAYNKDHPNYCGHTTGNWGFIDFNASGNSNRDTVEWIRNGYPGVVEPGWYEGDPGTISTSHASALDHLVSGGLNFWLPVFTEAKEHGATAEYLVTEFIGVRFVGFKATGSEESRYLDMVIDPSALEASCCQPPPDFDNGARVTGLVPIGEDGNPIGLVDPDAAES